jgi:hypothetical protein
MSDETPEFNIRRAYLIGFIAYFIYVSLVLCLQFSRVINEQTEFVLYSVGFFAIMITGSALRKYRDEQKERKKEIERFRKW